jgi:hypothetical protein
MSGKQPYEHEGEVAGARRETAESEHRESARPAGPRTNELDVEARKREQPRRSTHQDTRIDPDPRFEETDQG